MLSYRLCCCAPTPQSPTEKWSFKKQFFESINPKNDFKSNEELEDYLYQKSLEIQPKGVDTPTTEVKPKHPASTLRSPGIKPPKNGNHYTPNHPHGLHLHSQHSHSAPHNIAAAHQSNTVPNTPITSHETKRSLSQNNQEEAQFSMVDVRYDRKGTHQKIPVLQPPPLVPRPRHHPSAASLPPTTQAPMPPAPKSSGMTSSASSPSSTSTTPVSAFGPAPKLYPRRGPQPMSPLAKSPLTPSKDNSPSAFQFPYVSPPPLPPRPSSSSDASSPSTSSVSAAAKENQEQLRVIFDREESHSPTVRLSVPLPPALPPPRGSSVFRMPPPLPPKSNRHNSSSPTSSEPFEDPTSPSIFVNTPPPPLPPKTYRVSKK
uniref:DH domain-containing protein n=1 Tax=Caenorhabditis tropicalis TaxID=1561998 RepID=A0A1I7U6D4_9PELO